VGPARRLEKGLEKRPVSEPEREPERGLEKGVSGIQRTWVRAVRETQRGGEEVLGTRKKMENEALVMPRVMRAETEVWETSGVWVERLGTLVRLW